MTSPAATPADGSFGYGYFDDPAGLGYRGYHRDGNGDGGYLPWTAARDFCLANSVTTAVDVGCAKGFLVAELLGAGIDAVGYDVSSYALSFAAGLPCYRADVRDGVPRTAEAIFALGVLLYLDEAELPVVLAGLRRSTTRFLLFSSYYESDKQDIPDPLRRITRPYGWWRAMLASAGFNFSHRGECLTSTRPDKRPVYLEFPDFGYGPASTLLSLIRPVVDAYDWHVVSTGSASAFALAQLPRATLHELDTFPPHDWPRFADIAPAGAPVVSVTNPGFAGWALQNGYRVGIVDTLDWMWDNHDAALASAAFHLVQSYFGSIPSSAAAGRERVRPIVDASVWPTAARWDTVPGTAVIGFGGMHLPGADDLVADYVRWTLAAVLPLLADQADATSITIAGGRADLACLVPEPWSSHPFVQVRTRLSQAEYAQIARTAEHLVCSPGLASIYECAAGGLAPLWQPGFSMSMVLQSRHLASTGYPYLASWPWTPEVAEYITGLPEEQGVRYVAEHIGSTIADVDPFGECLAKPLACYIESAGARSPLVVPVDHSLPSGPELFADGLSRLA